MNSLSWIEIIGGGTIFTSINAIIVWLIKGRKLQHQEIKGGEIDVEVKEIDYAFKIHDLYEKIINRKDTDYNELGLQLKTAISDAKEDRQYFRGEINPLVEKVKILEQKILEQGKKIEEQDKEIADLQLRNAITKEAAASWEKKFNDLQKEHDQLKKAFDALKKSMK
jgi:chromosome segregation ATPase